MGFPVRLKKLRKEHKLTQQQLGLKINVTKVSISGYENGNRTPDFDTLQKIADFFEVSVDYLLGRTDDPKGYASNKEDRTFEDFLNDPETEVFFKEYAEAPEERREELRKFWEIIKSRKS